MAEERNEILEQKLNNNWDRNPNADNFFELNEITVTITLSEYRKLVHDNAANECILSRRFDEKLRLEAKIEELQATIKELKGE